MSDEEQKRLEELEIKLVYQEDLIQTLNSVMSEQQQQLLELREICRLLNAKIESFSSQNTAYQQEIPPHY